MSDCSGYHACACRDCFDIAIGVDSDGVPSLCHDCEAAGCCNDARIHARGTAGECQRSDAYGMHDPEEGEG